MPAAAAAAAASAVHGSSAPPALQSPAERKSRVDDPPHAELLKLRSAASAAFRLRVFVVSASVGRRELLEPLLAGLAPALSVTWVQSAAPDDVDAGPGFVRRGGETRATCARLEGHVRAARALVDSGAPVALVLEDDARLHVDALSRLEALVAWQRAHDAVPLVQVRGG